MEMLVKKQTPNEEEITEEFLLCVIGKRKLLDKFTGTGGATGAVALT